MTSSLVDAPESERDMRDDDDDDGDFGFDALVDEDVDRARATVMDANANDDDDARTGRGLTGTTRAGTREKVSRSWNRGAAREHRGGEERGEDVEVVSGTKGARAG